MNLIEVGTHFKRKVTPLNKELFEGAEIILDKVDIKACNHMGWYGIGNFIDWLEENYDITKKEP